MVRWTEVSRRYTPPPTRQIEGSGATALEKIVHSFTVIELKHKNGKIKFIEQIGDQTRGCTP